MDGASGFRLFRSVQIPMIRTHADRRDYHDHDRDAEDLRHRLHHLQRATTTPTCWPARCTRTCSSPARSAAVASLAVILFLCVSAARGLQRRADAEGTGADDHDQHAAHDGTAGGRGEDPARAIARHGADPQCRSGRRSPPRSRRWSSRLIADPVDDADLRLVHQLVPHPEPTSRPPAGGQFFAHPSSQLANYHHVLSGEGGLVLPLVNSLAITIPATIIPIFLASMAAYGLAWVRVPRQRLHLLHASSRCRWCRCRWRWYRCSDYFNYGVHIGAVTVFPNFGRQRRWPRSGFRTRCSRCRWRCSCCTTSSPSCPSR